MTSSIPNLRSFVEARMSLDDDPLHRTSDNLKRPYF